LNTLRPRDRREGPVDRAFRIQGRLHPTRLRPLRLRQEAPECRIPSRLRLSRNP